MTKFGAWIDDAPRLVRSPTYWDDAKKLGISTAGIMIESVGRGFDPNWTESDLGVVGGLCKARGIDVVLTIWPEPGAEYLRQLDARIDALLRAAGAVALECDDESNTTEAKCKAVGTTMDAFASSLDAFFVRRRKLAKVRIETTTFALHSENGPRAKIANRADVNIPQGYSVAYRKNAEGVDELVDWGGNLGPGGCQKTTFDRAMLVPRRADGGPGFSAGLAAYDQAWPGQTPAEAMKLAWDAAQAYNPREVRYWSSKWIWGSKKASAPYAAKFLASLPR